MPRYKLTIEYDGTPFVGWQMQDNGATVQGALTEAIAAFTGERAPSCTAPAAPMPACMRSARSRMSISPETGTADNVRDAINFHLRPQPIAVLAAERVAETFDARFSAIKRHYLYRIVNRRADLALEQNRAWRVPRPLDCGAMHAAAQRLIGKHDFTTFRSTECQAKSPVKTLDRLDVARDGDDVRITASARSFLQHQVRSMVGSLVHVGEGKWSADDLAAALAARDRAACGQVAPPQGLYLVRVEY